MNIQIFGKVKCFDTKKAQRYFKERRIKFQFIDLAQKGFSPWEWRSVRQKLGYEDLVDTKCRAYQEEYMDYITREAAEEKLFLYPELLKTPIVRNGREVTVGYCPEIWKSWS